MFLVSKLCLGFRSHVVFSLRDFFFLFGVWFLEILVIFFMLALDFLAMSGFSSVV